MLLKLFSQFLFQNFSMWLHMRGGMFLFGLFIEIPMVFGSIVISLMLITWILLDSSNHIYTAYIYVQGDIIILVKFMF